MKSFQLCIVLTLSFFSGVYAGEEEISEESWYVQHDIRSIEHHINVISMSKGQLSRFIHRIRDYIKDLQMYSARPTVRELDILNNSCAKIDHQFLKYSANEKLKKEITELHQDLSDFLLNTINKKVLV